MALDHVGRAGGRALHATADCRPLARAAGPPPPCSPAAGLAVDDDTDVATALRAACEALGRPFSPDLVATLEANWFTTAGDLAAMTDADARSLGLPLRLKSALAGLLGRGLEQAYDDDERESSRSDRRGGEGGGAGAASPATGVVLPTVAVQLVDTFLARAEGGKVSGLTSSSSNGGGEARRGGDSAAASSPPTPPPITTNTSSSSSQDDFFQLPIEERQCPLMRRYDNPMTQLPKVSKRGRPEPYALKV